MAHTLRHHGIQAGNTVALHGAPSYTQLWSLLALWSIGAQVVLLEPRLAAEDRYVLLRKCRPQYLLTFGGNRQPAEFVDECEVAVRPIGGEPARTSHCVVQFSSGTTGRPKAVGRTSESLLVELDRLHTVDGAPRRGDTVAVLESTAHSFGLIAGLLHAMDVGATVVFPRRQTPAAIKAATAAATVVFGNPRHFEVLARAGDLALPGLRIAVSGGEVLWPEIFDAFGDRHGTRIGQAYGTTETGIVAADFTGGSGPLAIGRPVAGVRTRVVDGVLQVHVPQSPYLYQDPPWFGGWMSTSDLVSVDPATGALRLRGRLDGHPHVHVDLLAIESVLRSHEHVIDAIVIGSEPLEAHVATDVHLDQFELQSWCRRFLDAKATPSRYHILRNLPRTANGKMVRDRRLLNQYRQARPPLDLVRCEPG